MALSLITPVGSDFIRDWTSQNAVNCNRIDDFTGPALRSNPIQDYVPVLTATTTNPSLGVSGTLVGKYYRVFDQIYTWGEFRFGTGASVGSGIYRISLPFRAKSLAGVLISGVYQVPIAIGEGLVYQNSADTGRQAVETVLATPDSISFLVRMGTAGASRAVSHNIPIAWSGAGAPGDGVMWSARYQRDSS